MPTRPIIWVIRGFVLFTIIAFLGAGFIWATSPPEPAAKIEAAEQFDYTVTIIDVREIDDCKYSTLMLTKHNGWRFTRCAYLGEKGDTFKYPWDKQ